MNDKQIARLELNPTPDNPLVKLTTRIEELVADEPMRLAISALISAALRTEIMICRSEGLDPKAAHREAAKYLAKAFTAIARYGDA